LKISRLIFVFDFTLSYFDTGGVRRLRFAVYFTGMKYSVSLLILWVVVFSCSSPVRRKPGADSLARAGAAPDPMHFDTVLPFSGVWMDSGYLQRIRSTRSPHESQIFKETCYFFPVRTLQNVKVIWNFHEGGTPIQVVRDGGQWKLLLRGMADSVQRIEILGAGQLRIGRERFFRIAHGDSTLEDWGVVEETLFQGRYRDSAGRTVEFSANGGVSGLDSFRSYVPFLDYIGVPQPVDRIRLIGSGGGQRDLGFRFAGDSLVLCAIKCEDKDTSSECSFEDFGERVYSLIRDKK
jgi:hypothetical protein